MRVFDFGRLFRHVHAEKRRADRADRMLERRKHEADGLTEAAMEGDAAKLKRLLRREDVDIAERDGVGLNALHWAASNGHLECCALLVHPPRILSLSTVFASDGDSGTQGGARTLLLCRRPRMEMQVSGGSFH